MRHSWLAAPLLAVAVLAAPAAFAATVQGTFKHDDAASDNISKAIDQAVADMNFVIRPIAHSRLAKTNEPYKSLTISFNAKEVRVQMGDRAPIVSPANGQTIKWKREDGETLDVGTLVKGAGQLEQSFTAPDGKRVNEYTIAPDGKTLTMAVTITSPKLSHPLTYKQVYHRAQ